MLRVIVNSTPLITLGNIGKLEILRQVYEKIVMPEAVYQEVSKKQDASSNALRSASEWILVESIINPADYQMYRSRLHAGEVEVMILAQQSPKADLIVLDDMAARRTAEYLDLTVTGTIGVLIKAKQRGLIPAVLPVLEELESNGFFISERVKRMIAAKTGE